ncbi:MAG: hypothetical protein AYK22_04420 [Thermoplasmatales archaeon SG8-52-3]|nr:MAG: hypothetical protein AYK22_04420 [Thermoplasmatales archaeon SG8-52-3]
MQKMKNTMDLWVKSEIGVTEPQEIEADPTENIGKFKERCAASHVVENEDVVLMHNDEVLKEDRRLKDYGIKENETLKLVPKHAPGSSNAFFSVGGDFPHSFSQRISRESTMIMNRRLPIKSLNPTTWIMWVEARKGPWKGKRYKVLIELDDRYPFVSPKVTFLSKEMTPVHPNIFCRTGYICFYMFKSEGWRPDFTLISCYYGIIWLLENPNFEDNRPNVIFSRFWENLKGNRPTSRRF